MMSRSQKGYHRSISQTRLHSPFHHQSHSNSNSYHSLKNKYGIDKLKWWEKKQSELTISLSSSFGVVLTSVGGDRYFIFSKSRRKGISASAKPYKRSPPSWLKISAQDVQDSICKLAKKGMTPSQIGVILRDSHGISQVNSVTGSKILRILKAHGLALEIPEDLYHLIKKAVAIRKHLERNSVMP